MPIDTSATAEPRLLALLQELLQLPAMDLQQALRAACDSMARWLACEKVDVFLYEAAKQRMVAVGTSDTPLGDLQKALGLDVLPLANGGRVVHVYRTGETYVSGRVDQDAEELRGVVRELGVRSQVAVPLEINGTPRGVLSAVSQTPERFQDLDPRGMALVGRSIGALAHRAELVQQMRSDEAERARRVTADEIVTVLAHDVRNYLVPLSSRLQTMKLKLSSGREVTERDLDAPLAAVQRLSRLTQDLLDVARLDQGLFELVMGPVDLSALVKDVAFSLAGSRGDVQVTAPASLMFIADEDRLRQALENVVSNALKHSPPGDPVRITLTHDKEACRVHVDVVDSGGGVPPELLPRLFERFVSAPGSHGLGLGLYVAQRVTLAHGGTLTVDSALGAGARFRFTLPV
jgi:two-component system OmpR family sensor kinase